MFLGQKKKDLLLFGGIILLRYISIYFPSIDALEKEETKKGRKNQSKGREVLHKTLYNNLVLQG